MRKIIISLFLASLLFAGVYLTETTKTLFYDRYDLATMTIPVDSVKLNSTGQYYTLNTVSTAADSMQSAGVMKNGVESAQTIYCAAENVSGTQNIEVYYGIYRGVEAGWAWTKVATIEDATVQEIDINDSSTLSFGNNRISDVWGVKFKESGVQSNKIWVRVISKETD